MDRRRAMGLAFRGAASACLGAAVGCRPRAPSGGAIGAVVASTFPYLDLRPADLERFAREFLLEAPRAETRLKRRPRSEAEREDRAELEGKIAETFLLSTDFFVNGAEEGRPVRFVAFYAPRRSGCQNPFARFDLD